MAAGGTVRSVDHGYAAMVARLYGAAKSKPTVSIGVLAAEGDELHGKAISANRRGKKVTRLQSVTEGDVTTVLEVAIWNEFGTSRIPSRSFLRAWFDENQSVIREKFRLLMRSVLKGDRTKEQILELLGQWCVGQVQLRIARGIGPENATSTVKTKGSSKPLIDTGVLRSSITYRVDGG